jgi:hypothetical protein
MQTTVMRVVHIDNFTQFVFSDECYDGVMETLEHDGD